MLSAQQGGTQVTSAVRLLDVSVTLGKSEVLRDVSIDIEPGELVALMGPSGSGKSTLLGLVSGTLVPSAGTVEVGGVTVSDLDGPGRARFRRTEVGLLFQSPDLLPELLVWENVALLLLFDGASRAEAHEMALRSLESVGMASHEFKNIDELSGGEAQRVALARALARPGVNLLIADEPTAALDAANAALVTSLIVERARAHRMTALIATHDAHVAGAMDRVIAVETLTPQSNAW